jgi:uncharacterized CHY-type Zn-finger protein
MPLSDDKPEGEMPPQKYEVRGIDVDAETRCGHYHKPTDIIAIKMRCCGVFYACKECHDALAGHVLEPWPASEQHERAILCGACRTTLTIAEYLHCDYRCPNCGAAFNPGCRNHYHFYFSPTG